MKIEIKEKPIYRVMEIVDNEAFTWYFHNLEKAINRLNEVSGNNNEVEELKEDMGLNFDNWTYSLYQIMFED